MQANNTEKHKGKEVVKSSLIKRPASILNLLAVVIIIGLIIFFLKSPDNVNNSKGQAGVFTVRRDNLTISVTENGDIRALNSTDIKSKVEGRTTIISIVDEGTNITQADVDNGKVLVELDSSEIKGKLTEREIGFLNAEASYTESKESLDIQINQNDSDIKAGEMKAEFASMDLYKYLGEVVAEKLISNDNNKTAELIKNSELGGEALQELRKLDGDIYLKEQELELAKSKYEWTEKLYEKDYVSLSNKKADRLDQEQKEIARDRAKTAKDLFVKYTFPKEAKKLLSDYREAKRGLQRIRARARSKLAQAKAKLKSEGATYSLQKERLEKLQKQFEACIIKAPAPGQVVYSSSTDQWARRNRPIEIGADIRERQKIISIPDPTEMKVEIKVHETWIDKVQPGQKANITVAAFPELVFTGTIMKKAPLADPTNWLNPDLKVYKTDVCIEGEHDFLKTGMTGKVEIIIEELKDVIIVPIQAVINKEGKKICYVRNTKISKLREVETGAFNENFVEIKSGLSEGEKVLLNPSLLIESDTEKN